MELNTRESSERTRSLAKASISGLMEAHMKERCSMDCAMAKENTSTPKRVSNTMASGKTGCVMDMESSSIKMALFIKATGKEV